MAKFRPPRLCISEPGVSLPKLSTTLPYIQYATLGGSPRASLNAASKTNPIAGDLPLSMSTLCMVTTSIDGTSSVAGTCVPGPKKFQALCERCNARAL